MSTESSFETAIRTIIAKAVVEADFRALCLSNPAEAARQIGVQLPSGITFAETAGNASAILLPPFGADPDEIHDDVLLADVTGGSLGPEYGGSITNSATNPSCQTP